jgi:hypothetical protein
MTYDAEDEMLEALRHGWDRAYEFGAGIDGFWARRRDRLGAEIRSADPDELRRLVREDYSLKPVRDLPDQGGQT